MRKRERENPCSICGHYHKYEEGEPCSICGHRLIPSSSSSSASSSSSLHVSAFPSEVLPDFLYLGSYDNASRSELLKSQGISRILNECNSGKMRGYWYGNRKERGDGSPSLSLDVALGARRKRNDETRS